MSFGPVEKALLTKGLERMAKTQEGQLRELSDIKRQLGELSQIKRQLGELSEMKRLLNNIYTVLYHQWKAGSSASP